MVFDAIIERAGLADIHDKVRSGERLSTDDGLRLYASDDLPILGYLANIVRERLSADATYYVRNQHINYTNVCNKLCKFCSFYVKPKDERGYVLDPEQVAQRVRDYAEMPITDSAHCQQATRGSLCRYESGRLGIVARRWGGGL